MTKSGRLGIRHKTMTDIKQWHLSDFCHIYLLSSRYYNPCHPFLQPDVCPDDLILLLLNRSPNHKIVLSTYCSGPVLDIMGSFSPFSFLSPLGFCLPVSCFYPSNHFLMPSLSILLLYSYSKCMQDFNSFLGLSSLLTPDILSRKWHLYGVHPWLITTSMYLLKLCRYSNQCLKLRSHT